jgi:hypothetical protein
MSGPRSSAIHSVPPGSIESSVHQCCRFSTMKLYHSDVPRKSKVRSDRRKISLPDPRYVAYYVSSRLFPRFPRAVSKFDETMKVMRTALVTALLLLVFGYGASAQCMPLVEQMLTPEIMQLSFAGFNPTVERFVLVLAHEDSFVFRSDNDNIFSCCSLSLI